MGASTVSIGRRIEIENPSSELLDYVKNNLVVDNPDFTKKLRMGFWLGNTPKHLHLYETNASKLILPFGVLHDIWHLIKGYSYTTHFPELPLDIEAQVSLYDYQETAVSAMVKAKNGILLAMCGGGKTRCGLAYISQINQKALWLTHTGDLLTQSKNSAIALGFDPAKLGTITGGKVNIGEHITFATVQTLSKLNLQEYTDTWSVVIVDECQHLCGTPTKVMQFYKCVSALNARHKFGLTATLHRSDGLEKCITSLVGNVIHEVPREAVAANRVSAVIQPVYTNIKLPELAQASDGTLDYTKLVTALCEDEARNKLIANMIASDIEQGHSVLVLSDRIFHLENLIELLPLNIQGIVAKVDGKMTSKKCKETRQDVMAGMRTSELKGLFASYMLAKEGLDIVNLDRLYLTTPHSNYTTIVQSAGRIERKFEGKNDAIVYDFVDDFGYASGCFAKRKRHYKKNGNAFIKNISYDVDC